MTTTTRANMEANELTLVQTPIILLAPAEAKINFKPIFQVDTKYIPQAIALARVFQDAVEPKDLSFDFEKALKIVKADLSLALIGSHKESINRNDSSASLMVGEIIKVLNGVLGAICTDAVKQQLTKIVTSSYTNLKEEENSVWVFWKDKQEHKVTYHYQISFAIQNQDTGGVMAVMPVALKMEANISQKELFGIRLEDKHNFSTEVKAITVVQALKNTL